MREDDNRCAPGVFEKKIRLVTARDYLSYISKKYHRFLNIYEFSYIFLNKENDSMLSVAGLLYLLLINVSVNDFYIP
jgi:hypothetical protein